MTGDVEEECSLLRIPRQLASPIPSDTCVSATQAEGTAYINSNITVDDTCMFAAIPSELAGNFPEGTVLQVMPDATVVALAMKNIPTSNASAIVYKDPVYISENTSQNAFSNLLPTSVENAESQVVSASLCTENVSDIDLSFLNETEVTSAITDSKYLNENAVKELQGIIADVSSQSISLLQNNLVGRNERPSQELEQVNEETSKDSESQPDNVVMIDVSKPIQLSQNSLIMVEGKKCILQQDPQTGQVIAFPVKEPEKPRRRRGRPRKTSLEAQLSKEVEPPENENYLLQEESMSEGEREKGLLEVINDDGALVRRSTRKRKKNKVLRDYETGNLQQELGSDVDDGEIIDKEAEMYIRRRKAKGPGRPRKYARPLEVTPHILPDYGMKRQRGRPRKIPLEIEPTQAFLVQTADGQTLMMQVPMSSIPPGVSLQQMAENIAIKLNEGLNQPNNLLSGSTKDSDTNAAPSASAVETITSTTDTSLSEPALQDHSIGSTTNCSGVQQQLSLTDENSEGVSSCQDMINNIESVIVDTVGEAEEITVEGENCAKDVAPTLQDMISENILDSQNSLTALDIPHCSENSFCINISQTTTTTIDSTPTLADLVENVANKYCVSKQVSEENLSRNFEQAEAIVSSNVSEDLFNKNEISKDKVNYQLLLQNGDGCNTNVQNIPIEQLLKSVDSSNISEGLILNVNDLKVSLNSYPSDLMDSDKNETDIIKEISDINKSDQITRNSLDNESVDPVIISSIDHNYLGKTTPRNDDTVPRDFLETAEGNTEDDKSMINLAKQNICPDKQSLEAVLTAEEIAYVEGTSIQSDETDNTNVASNAIDEKPFPMILPAPPLTGLKTCKICRTPYTTDEELVQHFRTRHPKCICTECDYMAERPYVIKRHFYRHSNQPCVCRICNKQYKDLYILKMHIRMVHLPPDILYTCDICEKQFTRKAHLKRHLRIHAPVKQFQCPHCDYKGCEKSDITKHLLIHQAPKFRCETCGKRFRHLKNKELHMKRHSGKKDYKCGMCEFYGYTFTDIRKHIERRHSNAACPDCGSVFKDATILKDHKKAGVCQPTQPDSVSVQDIVKIENPDPEDSQRNVLLDEVPMDLLEGEPQHIMIRECSEETLSAIQNGQFVMTAVEGVLNNGNGQFVMEGLEDNIVIPDSLSVVSVQKDSNLVTLVSSDGRNFTIPLKNCPFPVENDVSADQNISQKFIIGNSTESDS